MIIAHKAQLSSQDCASIRILYSEKEGRYELFYFAFIRTRTCRTYRLFRRCMVLKCEKLSNCAPIRPFDSHQMLIKQKDISQGYVFCLVPPCKLKICNFAKFSTNTSVLLSFAHYRESLRLTYTNFSHGTGTHLDCFPYIYKMSALSRRDGRTIRWIVH